MEKNLKILTKKALCQIIKDKLELSQDEIDHYFARFKPKTKILTQEDIEFKNQKANILDMVKFLRKSLKNCDPDQRHNILRQIKDERKKIVDLEEARHSLNHSL